MPLFGKRKRPSVDASTYEAPPIEDAPTDKVGSLRPSPYPDAYGRLTSEDVRSVRFGKPRTGRRGYDDLEVDAFLDLVEVELEEPRSPPGTVEDGLRPEDVETWVFSKPPLGKRGYNEEQVDAFLQRIAAELRHRAT
jgi:DivIVA domain-containing protein